MNEHKTDGRVFHFNDHVCIELLFGVPDERRTGRLVQVRKGCGQFGSDVYFVRLRDNSLVTFENALIRHADDKGFEENFYRSNGRVPPVIPHQPAYPGDTENTTYSIRGEWPEVGFIVERPKQPETPGCFALITTEGGKS